MASVPTYSDRLRYPGGRTWPEVKHLMGKDMGEMMSGAPSGSIWLFVAMEAMAHRNRWFTMVYLAMKW